MNPRHALVAAALLAAEPVQAAEYIITYTGTVSASHDGTGTFGDPNASLDGLAFTAVYRLTAPLPGAYTSEGEFSARIWGGAQYAAPSPLSATLTINGITQVVSGNQSGDVEQRFVPDEIFEVGEIRHLAKHFSQTHDDQGFFQQDSYLLSNTIRSGFGNFDFLNTTDYTASLDYDVRPGDVSRGSFRFEEFRYDGIHYAYGDLTATHVTIAPAPLGGAVPEPSTWAMLLLGFGAVGAGLRSMRRRQRVAANCTKSPSNGGGLRRMRSVMRRSFVPVASLLAASLPAAQASAATLLFEAPLSPEAPGATGTGLVQVTFDTDAHTLAITANWSGLTGTTTQSHIHCCVASPGTGTTGVAVTPGTLPGFPLGVSSGTYSTLLDLTQSATYSTGATGFLNTFGGGTPAGAETALLAGMQSGRAYFNIHTTMYLGGEIRGFLAPAAAVPEPTTWTMLLLGFGAVGARMRLARSRPRPTAGYT